MRVCQFHHTPMWYSRWDLNPQALRHDVLSVACLPISPLEHGGEQSSRNPSLRTNCFQGSAGIACPVYSPWRKAVVLTHTPLLRSQPLSRRCQSLTGSLSMIVLSMRVSPISGQVSRLTSTNLLPSVLALLKMEPFDRIELSPPVYRTGALTTQMLKGHGAE